MFFLLKTDRLRNSGHFYDFYRFEWEWNRPSSLLIWSARLSFNFIILQGSKRREPGDAIHNQDMVVTPEMVQFFAQKGKCGNHVLLRGVVCYGHLYFTYFDILSYELNLPIGSEETFGHSSDVVHKEGINREL